jgi:hypothetical protein
MGESQVINLPGKGASKDYQISDYNGDNNGNKIITFQKLFTKAKIHSEIFGIKASFRGSIAL